MLRLKYSLPRALVLLGLACFCARFIADNTTALTLAEQSFAQKGQEMVVAAGDVQFRDVPKALEFLRGRTFTDPLYRGEVTWYPFMTPLLAAATAKVTGLQVHAAYFRIEVLLCALNYASVAIFLYVTGGLLATALLPLVLWAGWFRPPEGLYPGDAARWFFLLYVMLLSAEWNRVAGSQRLDSWVRFVCLGVGLGVLGLWMGGLFFVAMIAGGVFCAVVLLVGLRTRRAARAIASVATLIGSAVMVFGGLFILPQLIRYGGIRQAGSARLFLAPHYNGGVSAAALWKFPFVAKALGPALLVLILMCVFCRARRHFLTPIVITWLSGALLGSLGYAANDPSSPILQFIYQALPAPAHTFSYAASLLDPLMCVLALGIPLELWLSGTSPSEDLLRRLPTRPALVASMLSVCLWLTMETPKVAFFADGVARDVADFARRAARITRGATTYLPAPVPLMSLGSLRPLFVGLPDHTNHYAQADRARAQATIQSALSGGDLARANELLDQYDVAYVVEQTGVQDPIIRSCGGRALVRSAGMILRKRARCR